MCRPFVKVLGKAMLEWLLQKLKDCGVLPSDRVFLIYNPSFLTMQPNMEELLGVYSHVFSRVKLVHLPGPTRGAAETVLFGLKKLSESELKNPCMLLDGDCFYKTDIIT